MNYGVRPKEEALSHFAERLLRLGRLKELGVTPGRVIDIEVKLITSLIREGVICPLQDREAIRETIILRLGKKIAEDWIRRAGGRGVECTRCHHFDGCGARVYVEQYTADDFIEPGPCEKFIMQITPSQRGEYQSCLMRLDRCYGIAAIPDFAEADKLADSLIREYREAKGRTA